MKAQLVHEGGGVVGSDTESRNYGGAVNVEGERRTAASGIDALLRCTAVFCFLLVVLSGALGSFTSFVPKSSRDVRDPIFSEHLRPVSQVMVDRVSITIARPWGKKAHFEGDSGAISVGASKAGASTFLIAVLACGNLSPCGELRIHTYIARAPPSVGSYEQ